MRELYPAIEPNSTFELPVDDLHTLYVEESGNPAGIPAVFVHGGPGGGCSPDNRRFFDPERYRIVLFDQRGSGRSTPHAELRDNTTQALVADMERIREHLGIDRWLVFGGSWGSTLALVYAETHPDRVLGLVVRGIFLCRRLEFDWFYNSGTRFIYPDHYEDYAAVIPESERDDMINAYYRRLTSDDLEVRREAARAWSLWEGRCSTLLPSEKVVDFFSDPDTAMAIARIECHYFVNNGFLRPNQILEDAGKLAEIPGVI
ncbi:MAG: prolyl aminopeptidase, partial [Gammaproteobacteria bacterium]